MSYADDIPAERRTLDAATVLDAVNAEISFYRTRQMSVYYSAIGAQVLVVTGDRFVNGLSPYIAYITYLVFFAGVVIFAFVFGGAYARRIWSLRSRRAELLSSCGFHPSPLPPHSQASLDSPSWYYAALILLLSIVGAVLTIFGGASK